MKKTDLAYIAGIIDTDGYIGFLPSHPRKKLYYYPRVSVTNTKRWLLEWLKFAFGGTVTQYPKYKDKHRDAWIWAVVGKSAVAFLLAIRPFLRVRAREAELALLLGESKEMEVQKSIASALRLSED